MEMEIEEENVIVEVIFNKEESIDEAPGIDIIKLPTLKPVQIRFLFYFICCIRILSYTNP
jgi:hypothetical protein